MNPNSRLSPLFAAIFSAGLLCPIPASADVRLPAMFSDHMVLQRGAKVPVWGWAAAGETVTVSIGGKRATATADTTGKWSLQLDALEPGEAQELTVKGNNTLTIRDVLVGEVWLASGQSNMQMPVNGTRNAKGEIAAAKFPKIRMFTVERKVATTPQEECSGKWVVCSPETVMHFSATAYYFGRDIHQTLKVPVGLINASWGGTTIEAWTSMETQQGIAELAPVFETWRQKLKIPFDEATANARYEKQMQFWKTQVGKAKAEGKKPPQQPKKPIAPRMQPNHPANLFNGMIAPLVPYAIRGGIWYQGESNSNGAAAKLYQIQLPLMIENWRGLWKQGDFPFAWVQLPYFKKRVDDPAAQSGWSVVREGMLKSLSLPNTGMAICIDAGEADNIHPKDKQTVGKRLALWARARVYDEKIAHSGPLPAGNEVKDGSIAISFTHADGGLLAKSGGDLKGFAIAGADKKWVWAKARIDGGKVIVSSDEVPAPVAVRYAWADNPDCNLANGAGLPASPFRTDDW